MLEYESHMEKILDEQENLTVVTNPHERCRTFLRKIAFRWQVLRQKLSGSRRGARAKR